tara:strand:- start:2669 stop:3334 length:666 start_codon:yes stop_codon:yes gene_type:complete
MDRKLLIGVSALALTLGACADKQPKPMVETPYIKYKTEKVKAESSLVPKWYKELPDKKGSIFTTGSATAPDLQLSVDIAILNAKTTLADRINGKLDSMTKQFVAKIGSNDLDASVLTEIEKVSKNVIASVDVAGYNPTKIDVFPSGVQYRAFVLLEYNDKNAWKIIMNRLRKDRMIYSRLRSTEAWKELETEVDKKKNEEEAQSLTNIEKVIKKNREVTVQ